MDGLLEGLKDKYQLSREEVEDHEYWIRQNFKS